MKKKLLFFITVLLISCKKDKEERAIIPKYWQKFSVVENIHKNINFKKMNSETEFSILYDSSTLKPKTNNILFLSDTKIDFKDTLDIKKQRFLRNRNCSAYFFKSDTLSVGIMNSDGFGGSGFKISVFKDNYKIDYATFTDVEPFKNKKPKLIFDYKKLILNKKKYNLNDSIFGYIEFKCLDNDSYAKPVYRYGKGYFRAKIEKY